MAKPKRNSNRTGLLLLILSLASTCTAAEGDAGRAHEILRSNCSPCHSQQLALSGLNLDSRESALKGGNRGPALVAGKAAESKLIEAVERKGKFAMPPNKPLSASEVAVLRSWIDEGAPWATGGVAKSSRPSWWAFQPVQRPAVPAKKDPSVRNEIDHFVRLGLTQQKLNPSPQASKATLVRRAYMDLWGLPATAEQVKSFMEDTSPEAWPKLIDRLLASPHYGEKWGRHWLDLVRYADTAGFELDTYIHDAWRYRDWVIQAFNEDKPYDRFIREQIAADELMPEDPQARTGTGLYCVGPNRDLFPDQADINREETLTDYVDTTSAVFLGLTAGCARCHDHKFDPISQEDHYRIRAVFAPATKVKVALNRLDSLGFDVSESNREWKLRELGEQIRATQARCSDQVRTAKLNALPQEVREAIARPDSERSPRQRELVTEHEAKARVSDDEIRACMNPTETAALHEIEKGLIRMYSGYRSKPFACGIADWWNVSPKTIMPVKGSPQGREVQPGFFSVLGGGEVPPPAETREATGPIPLMPTTGRRTALANWIADNKNPLTARVMVNRMWQYHFGRGLIATPSDFGTRSGKPSHPELLDWLADEFVTKGWSMKHMHRLMMNSATYQQDSTTSKVAAERDPLNVYLSHFSRRRIDAEELRDSVLLATGGLNLKRGGRPVVPPLTAEEKSTLTQSPDNAWVLTADASEHSRRSIYMIQKRTFRMPMLEVFDAPETMLTCSRRDSSTSAPQSLSLFNGAFTMERARALARQLPEDKDENAVIRAWEKVLSRGPSKVELERALAFLKAQQANAGSREESRVELVRALLNLNEFLYVD
jgi:mono/diheme cytochrome c family protein